MPRPETFAYTTRKARATQLCEGRFKLMLGFKFTELSSTCRFQFGQIFVTLLAIKVKYEMETTAYREGTETMKNCCG
jgi:hypothetical protein